MPTTAATVPSRPELQTLLRISGAYLLVLFVVDAGKDALTLWTSTPSPTGPFGFLTDALTWWSAWALLLPLGLHLSRRIGPDRIGWLGSVAANILLAVTFVLLHLVTVSILFDLMSGVDDGRLVIDRIRRLGTIFMMPELMTVWGGVAVLYAFSFADRLREAATDIDPVPNGEQPSDRVMVRNGDVIRFVKADRIEWLESDGNYVVLHSEGERHRVRSTLQGLLERLDPHRFVRIHRSHAVSLDHVRELQSWFGGDYLVVMESGEELRMSRSYRDDVLQEVR